ncbi:hypothetical protein EHW61_16845 [Salinivibrio sp. VYel6]|uniref:hypothetical protein n=1 Tax=Salinivibrio sp. VYel6 TaxID=2490493 RepID=UPI00128B53C3|nr:hypothetical protein [Salinivibrio sp. VYel6]MPX98292.1 hypothetical protein [Salinivibrio sp. VYel6]
MSIQTRNNVEAFLVREVTKQLTTDGYTPLDSERGAEVALRHYRENAGFKGKAFEQCMARALQFLTPAKTAAKKRAAKKAKAA